VHSIEKYANQIPQQTRQLIAALDNPTRQAILTLLSEYGELSFTEIQKTLDLQKLTLNFHLKKLLKVSLIARQIKKEAGNQKYSHYTTTPLGSQILTSFSNARYSAEDQH